MPIGLMVCFSPIVIAWLLAGNKDSSDDAPKAKR